MKSMANGLIEKDPLAHIVRYLTDTRSLSILIGGLAMGRILS